MKDTFLAISIIRMREQYISIISIARMIFFWQ